MPRESHIHVSLVSLDQNVAAIQTTYAGKTPKRRLRQIDTQTKTKQFLIFFYLALILSANGFQYG